MSIVIVIIGISFLILVHELGHFLAAKLFGVAVEEFGFGFPPRIAAKKIGGTKYSFNWLPLGGFVKLHGEFQAEGSQSFTSQQPWRRATILVAGVAMNFLAGWLLLSVVFFIGSPQYVLVTGVLPDSPASAAGIKVNDRLIDFQEPFQVTDFVKGHRGQSVSLRLQRAVQAGGSPQTISVTAIPRDNLGVMITGVGLPPRPLLASIGRGLTAAVTTLGAVAAALGSVIGAPQNLVGPVGIFSVAVETGKLGAIYLLQLLALISLNLTVLNLLPVPALDGGRLFFLLLEKLKGSRLKPERELFWNAVGFAVLISLIAVITIKDISQLF